MRPVEFAGLARILGVQIVQMIEGEDKPQGRDFTDVFADVMARFNALNRQQKRDLLKLVKKSNSARGVVDASSAENT